MRVEARSYFDMVVQPACSDFLAKPWLFHLGVLALVATHHMVDYWFVEEYQGPVCRKAMAEGMKSVRAGLVSEHPDLEVLADAADAAKHGRLGAIKARSRHLDGVDQLRVTPSLFNAPFGQGVFAEAVDIYFDSADGRRVGVRGLIKSALEFWRCKLADS